MPAPPARRLLNNNNLYFYSIKFSLLLIGMVWMVGCSMTGEDRENVELMREEVDDVMEERAEYKSEVESLKNEVILLKAEIENNQLRIKNIDENILQTLTSLENRIVEMEGNVHSSSLGSRTKKRLKVSPQSLYYKGKDEYKKKKYRQAILTLKLLLQRYPQSSLVDDAHYWIGETYYQLKDYQKAILEFDIVRKKYSRGTAILGSLFKEALCFKELGSKDEAKLLLQSVIEYDPKSKMAKKAKTELKKI